MLNDPSVTYSRIGEYDADGNLLRDATLCFVTGKAAQAGDRLIRLDNRRFIRVKANVRMTPQEKDAVKAEALAQADAQPASQDAPPTPDYDSLTLEALRAEAERRGVDLEGVKTKSHVVARLRLADVQERFAGTPAEGEG